MKTLYVHTRGCERLAAFHSYSRFCAKNHCLKEVRQMDVSFNICYGFTISDNDEPLPMAVI